MASLQQKGDRWYCQFVYQGKRSTFTIGNVSQEEAETKSAQVDYLLLRLKQRLITIPPGSSIVDFVQFDGRPEQLPPPEKTSLDDLRQKYLDANKRSLEETTLSGARIHFSHLIRILGEKYPIPELDLPSLQRYVDKRATEEGMKGGELSAATIRKELQTLRTAWNWATPMKLVSGKFPNKGLRFPKSSEKLPFMTMEEIERRIAGGGLTEAEVAVLWDCLYLKVGEVAEFLQHIKAQVAQPFVYPMVCFAAYTGARRSEILRAKITDVDFDAKIVTIHEKKRVKGKLSTRRVPVAPFLIAVLKAWLAIHPGGPYLFCQQAVVTRSKKRSLKTGYQGGSTRPTTATARAKTVKARDGAGITPLTANEAHDHLKRVISDSKWKSMRGWHVCRHSFISACASKGIDQRLVEEWAGHMSKEMSRRYAHLYPSVQQEAMAKVFN